MWAIQTAQHVSPPRRKKNAESFAPEVFFLGGVPFFAAGSKQFWVKGAPSSKQLTRIRQTAQTDRFLCFSSLQ